MAKARFGHSGIVTDGKGLERVAVMIRDPFPSSRTRREGGDGEEENSENPGATSGAKKRRSQLDVALQEEEEDGNDGEEQDPSSWTPTISIKFHGSHVYAGIRQLVEAGIVDGERMPGWMTGEEGVTTGVVRQGRIIGHKGALS